MPTGTARIVLGMILTVLLGLFALRGVAVFVLGSLTGADGAFIVGTVFGLLLVTLLLVAVIRALVMKGFAQRRAYLSSGGALPQPVEGQNEN